MLRSCLALLACALLSGCTSNQSSPDSERNGAVPSASRMQQRHLIDFGGKVELLGFDLDAPEVSAPGSEVTIRMYWRRTAPLTGKWRLFTHLGDSDGSFENFDRSGSLRESETATPESWDLHRIYVDTQTLKIPEKASAEVTLLVGVWQGHLRLPVLSGPHDAENRGIVVHLKTR